MNRRRYFFNSLQLIDIVHTGFDIQSEQGFSIRHPQVKALTRKFLCYTITAINNSIPGHKLSVDLLHNLVDERMPGAAVNDRLPAFSITSIEFLFKREISNNSEISHPCANF